MAMFLAEITFLLELGLLALGLVLWHQGRQAGAGLLRTAGAVLVVGAALTALCTGYFSVRYQIQGDFDRAYPAHAAAPAWGHHGGAGFAHPSTGGPCPMAAGHGGAMRPGGGPMGMGRMWMEHMRMRRKEPGSVSPPDAGGGMPAMPMEGTPGESGAPAGPAPAETAPDGA